MAETEVFPHIPTENYENISKKYFLESHATMTYSFAKNISDQGCILGIANTMAIDEYPEIAQTHLCLKTLLPPNKEYRKLKFENIGFVTFVDVSLKWNCDTPFYAELFLHGNPSGIKLKFVKHSSSGELCTYRADLSGNPIPAVLLNYCPIALKFECSGIQNFTVYYIIPNRATLSKCQTEYKNGLWWYNTKIKGGIAEM